MCRQKRNGVDKAESRYGQSVLISSYLSYINRFPSHFLSSTFSISKIKFYLMHFSESSHMKGMLPAVRFFLNGKQISFPEFSKLFQTH